MHGSFGLDPSGPTMCTLGWRACPDPSHAQTMRHPRASRVRLPTCSLRGPLGKEGRDQGRPHRRTGDGRVVRTGTGRPGKLLRDFNVLTSHRRPHCRRGEGNLLVTGSGGWAARGHRGCLLVDAVLGTMVPAYSAARRLSYEARLPLKEHALSQWLGPVIQEWPYVRPVGFVDDEHLGLPHHSTRVHPPRAP